MIKKLTIYTDGACSGNPGPGGWGAVLIHPDGKIVEMSGGEENTTNNRMEIMGFLSPVEALESKYEIDVHTDSKYLCDGANSWLKNWKRNGWRTADKKPIKNEDLWRRIDEALGRHLIQIHWVRGHNGDRYNEIADRLAREGVSKIQYPIDLYPPL